LFFYSFFRPGEHCPVDIESDILNHPLCLQFLLSAKFKISLIPCMKANSFGEAPLFALNKSPVVDFPTHGDI
jgi:hypothetical protein